MAVTENVVLLVVVMDRLIGWKLMTGGTLVTRANQDMVTMSNRIVPPVP